MSQHATIPHAAIHATAIIDARARIGANVHIGAFSCIGPNVTIGADTEIGSHVLIKQDTVLGKHNRIYHGAVLGEDCQHRHYQQQPSQLIIGDHNVIREYCTIHRGSMDAMQTTRIGSHNYIMAGSHIAHDCTIGHHITMANQTALAGHVQVDDYANLAGYTLVHQFCTIGRHVMTGINSVITKDVPAFIKIAGNPARACGLNRIGIQRHGFSEAVLVRLKQAYQVVYRQGLTTEEALKVLQPLAEECVAVSDFTATIRQARRGILR